MNSDWFILSKAFYNNRGPKNHSRGGREDFTYMPKITPSFGQHGHQWVKCWFGKQNSVSSGIYPNLARSIDLLSPNSDQHLISPSNINAFQPPE